MNGLVRVIGTRRILGVILLAAASASCSSDGTAPSGASCTDATTSVDATIAVGASVTFDWTPACPVALVLVETESSGHDVWWIATFDADSDITPATENRIVPRITFGQVPSTAAHFSGPEPMVAGTTYTLVLWRNVPTGSTLHCRETFGTACLVAVKTFTR